MLAVLIFFATLVLVIWQPKGLGIGWSASAGAAFALATGVVSFGDVPVVWHIVWDATLTFIALILISLVFDEAGLFEWAALHVARWGRGDGRRLFPLTIILGALIAAFFANDGAALLLTPIVIALLHRLNFPEKATFAFIIATGFVADTTSLPLIISNLVNIVSANFFHIHFTDYARVMLPVDLAALIATLGVLWAFYGRAIDQRYNWKALDAPATAIRDEAIFWLAFPLLLALLAAYIFSAPYGIPISVVSGAGALLLLSVAGRWHVGGRGSKISVSKAIRGAPWQIVVFSVGMYLVVYGLKNVGLTEIAATGLAWVSERGLWAATLGTGTAAALLSSVMNNMPSVLIGTLSIEQAHNVSPTVRQAMIYANVIGCDLGPKFTPIGSLATLLWLHVLRQKGIVVSWRQYMLTGVAITPPVLGAVLLALAAWLHQMNAG